MALLLSAFRCPYPADVSQVSHGSVFPDLVESDQASFLASHVQVGLALGVAKDQSGE